MPVGSVTWSANAFKRAGFVGGGKLLLLETTHERVEALHALAVAVADSNNLMREREVDELWAQVNAPVPTPQGPVAHVVDCEPAQALTMMLELIARSLEREGITGALKPAKESRDRYFGNNVFSTLGAMLLLPTSSEQVFASYAGDTVPRPLSPGWCVEPDITRDALTAAIEWVLLVDGPVHVHVGPVSIRMDADAVPDFILNTLPIESDVGVLRSPGRGVMRQLETTRYGCVKVTLHQPGGSRMQGFGQLRDLVRDLAGSTQSAFVLESQSQAHDRSANLATFPPPVPMPDALLYDGWAITHLEGDYVYDAFATQVLTSSQLAKTRDLTKRWTVEDLGHDRYLVTHAQPEIWLDLDPTPLGERLERVAAVPPDVLGQAREDFGDAIMNAQTVEEHPPPLPRAEQVRALSLLGLTLRPPS